MNVITCKNIDKRFNDTKALKNLTLTVEENKITGLIGRNGAGKTTFLKMCAGYIRPTSGKIKIWDEDVFDNLIILSRIIFVDEEIQYDTGLKLNDILKLAGIYYENWDEKLARKLMDYFELSPKKTYNKLSRGMKTQFNIIAGICSRAPLTLMDEPTLGLDAAFRKEFYDILLKDYINNPRTIIISSHLIDEIENLLEEIIVIDRGSLMLHKGMDEFQNYGIMLNGPSDVVNSFIENRQVLSKQVLGNSMSVGIKNDLDDEDRAILLESGIEVSRMSTQDVCISITSRKKEGFFDGF